MFVSMVIFRALIDELAQLDVDMPKVLRSSGISPSEFASPSEGVPLRDFARVVYAALRDSRDPALGLALGNRTPCRALHVLSHLFRACSNLREAWHTFNAYAPSLVGVLRFQLSERQDLGYFGFELNGDANDIARFAAEYALTIALRMARGISPTQTPLSEAWFSHSRPNHALRYDEVFECPVKFNKPMNALVFARELLDVPLPHADPMVSAVLRGAADRLLIESALNENLSERVRCALRYEPALLQVDLDRFAGRWGMTRRTLIRRLREEGQGLSELLDEARFREASKELKREDQSIKRIAARLGFAEPSSFHRAFKRWAGVTPTQFRRRSQSALH